MSVLLFVVFVILRFAFSIYVIFVGVDNMGALFSIN
jgi:hypothetical protein